MHGSLTECVRLASHGRNIFSNTPSVSGDSDTKCSLLDLHMLDRGMRICSMRMTLSPLNGSVCMSPNPCYASNLEHK